eukprot:TRINITY_DN4981_c0_g2_i1.p1 TRINITY_DN4981_c0_g2~~TRINITY_DN4981_c0_g2_i1.p1  ORF type:complete len:238 (+),score=47.68 TRINITY_DN4981_c0_g2_i1:65-778(+)
MIRRPPRSTLSSSSAASDVYKRQYQRRVRGRTCGAKLCGPPRVHGSMAPRQLQLLLVLLGTAYGFPDTTCSPGLSGVDIVQQRGYNLRGKVVVLTGGDSGIGYGAATAIAAAGARLIMLGHNTNKTAVAAANITAATGNSDIRILAIDLLSLNGVRRTVKEIEKMTPRVDVLVCDAGQNYARPGHELTEDGFEATFQSTFLGHFLLTESLVPALRRSNGRVVNALSLIHISEPTRPY